MHTALALVDCNSFFCSCEILFNPKLINQPVIVLSNNDGCAVSRTPKAKALGIAMGAPYFKIREICEKNHVGVFSSNFSLYTNISDRVMDTLKQFSPKMEVYSVDEAWLDLSQIKTNDLHSYGVEIKKTVERWTGIPVSVGIGKTKMLAKAANHIAKHQRDLNGVLSLVDNPLTDSYLANIPVQKLWGFAKASSLKLHMLGIRNALQLKNYTNDKLIQKELTKVGLQRKKELMGVACFPIELETEKKKEIMCSRTFGSSVYDIKSLKESVANYTSNAVEKLRAQQSCCFELTIFARTNAFKDSPQYYAYETAKLLTPTNDTRELIRVAMDLVDKSYRGGYEYKKAGVKLSHLVDTDQVQLSLFEQKVIQHSPIDLLMDRINFIYGPQTLKSMACGVNNEAWKMLRNFKSPRFTTAWGELQKI